MWGSYWQEEFPRLTGCTWPGTIPFFALSSGTTSGTTKYIPVLRGNKSLQCLGRDRRSRASRCQSADQPRSRRQELYAGRQCRSDRTVARDPQWRSQRHCNQPDSMVGASLHISAHVISPLISCWEEKVEKLARACRDEDIRAISGTAKFGCSSSSSGSSRCGRTSLKELHDAFPNLELVVHGGVNFTPYQHQFAELLRGRPRRTSRGLPGQRGLLCHR